MLIPSVVFSSPGAHFSRERFHTNMERQYRLVVNIEPDSDLVARVDRSDATVQKIECRNQLEYGSFPGCHSISKTICELWRACGDPRHRGFGACDDIPRNTFGSFFASPDVTPQLYPNNYGGF